MPFVANNSRTRQREGREALCKSKVNKKVLQRECKRHTTRRVARTRSAVRQGVWTDKQTENSTFPDPSDAGGNKWIYSERRTWTFFPGRIKAFPTIFIFIPSPRNENFLTTLGLHIWRGHLGWFTVDRPS